MLINIIRLKKNIIKKWIYNQGIYSLFLFS